MKYKPNLSFYRCVCILSALCLFLPPVSRTLFAGVPGGLDELPAGFLSGSTVLLLLPVVDEYVTISLYYALAASGVCVAGVLTGVAAQTWLPWMLAIHGACLVRRSRVRHTQLQPLFKNVAVWYNIESHARFIYSLALYLLVASMAGVGVLPWLKWALLPLTGALYAILLWRVHTGRTCFLRPAREQEIKDLIRGNLRTTPAQAGPKTDDLARMTRLYERVVTLMEQKQPFLDEEFSLDDLAGAVYTNRGYLSRTINVLSGRNFSQFVNYFRVRYGVELIRKDPHLRLINVAQMCGFHSSPSFNAAFKVNMGETPSAFLERLRSERYARHSPA
ncbi:MAG: helix-turn-helix transcriptional regulator [Bacteroidales bacterium]|nr:helix-turn-helix transcriptional regulator [Bacteroidales bacterium]